MNERKETAEEIRDSLEVKMAVMQACSNKLTQFIEGEITEEEYVEWVDENDGMFEVVGL